MQIIWDAEAAKQLRKTHTLLELETFDVKGIPIKTWCVVPAEKIGLEGLFSLERYVELHEGFIKAYNEGNYQLVQDISEHLIGHWSGELDSFYEEILNRIKNLEVS